MRVGHRRHVATRSPEVRPDIVDVILSTWFCRRDIVDAMSTAICEGSISKHPLP